MFNHHPRTDIPHTSYARDIYVLVFDLFLDPQVSKILLLAYCTWVTRRTGAADVQAYAQDHLNDVISNGASFIALAIAVSHSEGGSILWILDPLAAVAVALWILYSWLQTGREHVAMLAGKSADPQMLRQVRG